MKPMILQCYFKKKKYYLPNFLNSNVLVCRLKKNNLICEIVRKSTSTIFSDSSDKISFQLADDVFLLQSSLDYSIENESLSNLYFPLHLACRIKTMSNGEKST